MGKYNFNLDGADGAKSRGTALRVHFKHTREIMHAIRGMKLAKAKKYLGNVLEKKEAVPYTKYTQGGIGRHAQLKQSNTPGSQGAWPVKATKVILDLLANAEANAETRGLDVDELSLVHCMANRASPTRRRTYRAHGRIGPYMARPAHCEVILAKAGDKVEKGEGKTKALKLSSKRAAQLRIKEGGGH